MKVFLLSPLEQIMIFHCYVILIFLMIFVNLHAILGEEPLTNDVHDIEIEKIDAL